MTESLATGAEVEKPSETVSNTGAEPVASPAPAASPEKVDPPAPSAEKPSGAGDAAGEKADGVWPANWREILAAGDEKTMERLGRFASPSDIWKAQEQAQKKISEGLKPRERPGPKATEEEWADYRKAAGIPATVDDFVKAIELPDKRQIGEEDLPVVQAFAERALKRGVPPADMAELVDEYYSIQEEQFAEIARRDAEFRRQSQQALKEEYGGDLDVNLKAMRPYFETVDPEMFDNLMGGRLADGTKIGDNPNLIRFFVAKALQENPAATVLTGSGTSAEGIHDEIKRLETFMKEDRNGWFKDDKARERYGKLIEARDKLAAK